MLGLQYDREHCRAAPPNLFIPLRMSCQATVQISLSANLHKLSLGRWPIVLAALHFRRLLKTVAAKCWFSGKCVFINVLLGQVRVLRVSPESSTWSCLGVKVLSRKQFPKLHR